MLYMTVNGVSTSHYAAFNGMTGKWKGCVRKCLWHNLRFYPRCCLEGPRELQKAVNKPVWIKFESRICQIHIRTPMCLIIMFSMDGWMAWSYPKIRSRQIMTHWPLTPCVEVSQTSQHLEYMVSECISSPLWLLYWQAHKPAVHTSTKWKIIQRTLCHVVLKQWHTTVFCQRATLSTCTIQIL
jgi:hypothetical protein